MTALVRASLAALTSALVACYQGAGLEPCSVQCATGLDCAAGEVCSLARCVDSVSASCGGADADDDEDGVANAADNCPRAVNLDQFDEDGDGLGDVCDGCPWRTDATADDGDGDGLFDACDPHPALVDTVLLFDGLRSPGSTTGVENGSWTWRAEGVEGSGNTSYLDWTVEGAGLAMLAGVQLRAQAPGGPALAGVRLGGVDGLVCGIAPGTAGLGLWVAIDDDAGIRLAGSPADVDPSGFEVQFSRQLQQAECLVRSGASRSARAAVPAAPWPLDAVAGLATIDSTMAYRWVLITATGQR
ncbi:MAG: hypothetical protein KBG28_17845 [Kofleriaceae bacterium]|jgi:hypothetical protein|nr:hypothetical protein [Kofleriaceae bacterium]MBP9205842.1 hypothetical protein [Kofleriaceae bacterium]